MIDAERMLGSLVRNAMRGGRKRGKRRRRGPASMLSRSAKGGLALGALGVAFGVYEHLTKQQGSAGSGAPAAGAQPQLPPLPAGAGTVEAQPPLPPLPTAGGSAPSDPTESQQEARLLVRAMIAAANADHEVDDEERARILQSLDEAGLGEEERRFVLSEIESPLSLGTLAAQVSSPELADRVYLASLMAIDVDTRAEEKYLSRLAERLGLDAERVARLEDVLAGGDGAAE